MFGGLNFSFRFHLFPQQPIFLCDLSSVWFCFSSLFCPLFLSLSPLLLSTFPFPCICSGTLFLFPSPAVVVVASSSLSLSFFVFPIHVLVLVPPGFPFPAAHCALLQLFVPSSPDDDGATKHRN